MMPRLLDISRAAGDANVGQTLLRLARLAETAHQFGAMSSGRSILIDENRNPQSGIDGPIPMAQVSPPRRTASVVAANHTEVV